MTNYKKRLKIWWTGILFLIVSQMATAQINVNIKVMPPYQSRITEYASRPELILMTVSNSSIKAQEIQLTASLKGDNGVAAWVRPGFRSPKPLYINPGEVINLNASDISFLFDVNYVEYTGISRSDISRGVGLLEGTYQLCVRALDYNSLEPVSPNEPLGCATFMISSVDPPRIISPVDQSIANNQGPQIIPITWSTPPGSSPLTQYRVKMVELMDNRNPNDALFTSALPVLLEETVSVTSLLYGPNYPQLTPGRQYALMVQAFDPFETISFKNEGKSEVVTFIYGEDQEKAAIAELERRTPKLEEPTLSGEKTFATNQISGRTMWAFTEDEERINTPALVRFVGAGFTNNVPEGLLSAPELPTNTVATSFFEHSPLQVASAARMAMTDPTLSSNANTAQGSTPSLNPSVFLFAGGARSLAYTYENISGRKSTNTRPLGNATITIRGVNKTKTAVQKGVTVMTTDRRLPAAKTDSEVDILASGTSDAQGRFSMQIIHPQYKGFNDYKQLIVVIQADGFEPYESTMDVKSLEDIDNMDLGELVLQAKNYRLKTGIHTPSSSVGSSSNQGVHYRLLRAAEDVAAMPHLMHEGTIPAAQKNLVNIQGRNYYVVAADSVVSSNDQAIESATFFTNKLFFGGDLHLQTGSTSTGFKDFATNINVADPGILDHSVLQAEVVFELENNNPSTKGVVVAKTGNSYTTIPGAIVTLSFDPDYVVSWGSFNPNTGNTNMYLNAPAGQVPANDPTNTQYLTANADPIGSMSLEELRQHYGQYTARTDSNGEFSLRGLPILLEGAKYSLTLVHVPYRYRDMPVTPDNKTIFFSGTQGQSSFHTFEINPQLVQLVGKVVDEDGQGIGQARLHFKNSTGYVETGNTGLFQTSYFEGQHTLLIEKEGYMTKEVQVRVGEQPQSSSSSARSLGTSGVRNNPGNISAGNDIYEQWSKGIKGTGTVQNELATGSVFMPDLFGWATSSNMEGIDAFNSVINTNFRYNEDTSIDPNAQDLGNIGPLVRKHGKVQFTLVDKDSQAPVVGALIELFGRSSRTDNRGQWLYEGFGGQALVTVQPPAGSTYYTTTHQIQIRENGELTEVRMVLERGVRLQGRIHSGNVNIADAGISIEGLSHLRTRSNQSGNYQLIVPAGELLIRVAKTGYYSLERYSEARKGSTVSLNFDLQSGGDRDIGSLLGFNIELDRSVPQAQGARWSGRFVNLTPVEEIFGSVANLEIPFTDIDVRFDESGKAHPVAGKVVTDLPSINLQLFDFLPVSIQAPRMAGSNGVPYITIESRGAGRGAIKAIPTLDGQLLSRFEGISFGQLGALQLGLPGTDPALGLDIFRSFDVSVPAIPNLRFFNPVHTPIRASIYGFEFELDLSGSVIARDGINFSGSLKTPNLGVISATSIRVSEMRINRSLRIGRITLDVQRPPTLNIGSFSASITNVLFNENGFKLGGQIQVSMPNSLPSTIDFSNLRISPDALYGGQFEFPTSGLDIYRIATLRTDQVPLSFGRVGNSNIYSLTGSARIKFRQLLTEEIRIPYFHVRSDGEFDIQTPVNYTANLSFAQLEINGLNIQNQAGSAPNIQVVGQFKLEVPTVTLRGSDIIFRAAADGTTSFDAGTIRGQVNAPLVNINLSLGLQNYGFEGGGQLNIPGTSISSIGVNFNYSKRPNRNLQIGADFVAGTRIVLGVVEINEVGGGFSYNPGQSRFSGTIRGSGSMTGMSAAVNLHPISLTVSDGPVIEGRATVQVANSLNVAQAAVRLDFRASIFSVTINSNIEPIKDVASTRINGLLKIKWQRNDAYVFLGASARIRIAGGLADANGTYAMGINIRNPKTRNDDIAPYFRMLDNDLYSTGTETRFSGVFLHVSTSMGVPKRNALGIDMYIVSGKVWFGATSDVMLILNFAQNDYRFRVAGNVGAGAEACLIGLCVSASFDACFALTGGYNDRQGWFLAGNVAGSFSAGVGCKSSCNSIGTKFLIPCGFKICVDASASFRISTRGSTSFSIGRGNSNNGNTCQL